jgi:CDGSH-type Zn-finger protein
VKPRITVVRGGPLLVEGPVPLVCLERLDRGPEAKPAWTPAATVADAGPYAVCRCGGTGTPPLCDREDRRCFDEPEPTAAVLPVTWTVEGLAAPALAIKPDGPVRVLGPIAIAGAADHTATVERCSLCRCGNSRAMPWCDGSHKVVGFRDP